VVLGGVFQNYLIVKRNGEKMQDHWKIVRIDIRCPKCGIEQRYAGKLAENILSVEPWCSCGFKGRCE
jgi:hypothetical protein